MVEVGGVMEKSHMMGRFSERNYLLGYKRSKVFKIPFANIPSTIPLIYSLVYGPLLCSSSGNLSTPGSTKSLAKSYIMRGPIPCMC